MHTAKVGIVSAGSPVPIQDTSVISEISTSSGISFVERRTRCPRLEYGNVSMTIQIQVWVWLANSQGPQGSRDCLPGQLNNHSNKVDIENAVPFFTQSGIEKDSGYGVPTGREGCSRQPRFFCRLKTCGFRAFGPPAT